MENLRLSLDLIDQIRQLLRGNIYIVTRHQIDEHLDDAVYLIETALANREKEALRNVALVGSMVANPAKVTGTTACDYRR
jgi:hypothetical protein